MEYELKEYEHLLDNHNWFDYINVYDKIINDHPDFKNFVEVGVWKGHSISYLADRLKDRDGVRISAVDLWETCVDQPGFIYLGPGDRESVWKYLYAIYNENLTRRGVRDMITDYKQCSWDAAKNFEDESLDFCFLDAGHTYDEVIKDIDAYLPKMKKTGLLAGHDIDHQPVRSAVYDRFDNVVEIERCWLVPMKS